MNSKLRKYSKVSIALLMVIFIVILLNGCSTNNQADEYEALLTKVEGLEKEIEVVKESMATIESNNEEVEYKVELQATKLANGQLLYTDPSIPMSITINNIMDDGFRVVSTHQGITLEYSDGQISDLVASFYLEDSRSIKEEQITFPYNKEFVIGTRTPIAYQIDHEDVIAKIQTFACQLRVNNVALYFCED
jgi:hypothetical protein